MFETRDERGSNRIEFPFTNHSTKASRVEKGLATHMRESTLFLKTVAFRWPAKGGFLIRVCVSMLVPRFRRIPNAT